jgi:hypothetical protein
MAHVCELEMEHVLSVNPGLDAEGVSNNHIMQEDERSLVYDERIDEKGCTEKGPSNDLALEKTIAKPSYKAMLAKDSMPICTETSCFEGKFENTQVLEVANGLARATANGGGWAPCNASDTAK